MSSAPPPSPVAGLKRSLSCDETVQAAAKLLRLSADPNSDSNSDSNSEVDPEPLCDHCNNQIAEPNAEMCECRGHPTDPDRYCARCVPSIPTPPTIPENQPQATEQVEITKNGFWTFSTDLTRHFMGPNTYLVDTSFSMSPHEETIQQIAELCGHPDPKSIKCKGGTKIGPSIDNFFFHHKGPLQDFVLVTDAEDGGFNDPKHILKTVEDIKARYPGIEIHLILNNPDLLPKLLDTGASAPLATLASFSNCSTDSASQIAQHVFKRASTPREKRQHRSVSVYMEKGSLVEKSSSGTRPLPRLNAQPAQRAPAAPPTHIPLDNSQTTDAQRQKIIRTCLEKFVLPRIGAMGIPAEERDAIIRFLLYIFEKSPEKTPGIIVPSLFTGKSHYKKTPPAIRGTISQNRMAPSVNKILGSFTGKNCTFRIFKLVEKFKNRPAYAVETDKDDDFNNLTRSLLTFLSNRE